jgi:hypothetical protein
MTESWNVFIVLVDGAGRLELLVANSPVKKYNWREHKQDSLKSRKMLCERCIVSF